MRHKTTVGYELREIHHLIGGFCSRNKKQNMEHLPRMQGWTIGFLYSRQDQDVFQKDVEAEFSISRATATHMLQALEQKEMIRRVPMEKDKRLKKIILTDKAKESHKQVIHNIEQLEKTLVQGFDEKEEEELLRLLKKVHQNLE